MNKLYSNNKHPITNIKNTGFKDPLTVQTTFDLIKKRSIIYQKSVIITMYNRAKYHANQTKGMRDAMKVYKEWLKKNKQ